MLLFREHAVELPLRTQGWVNNSLLSFSYKNGYFQAQHRGRMSDPFMEAVTNLHEVVLTKWKFLESSDSNMNEMDSKTAPCEGSAVEP